MLTHVDKKGNAKMVDISSKKDTLRMAEARGSIPVSYTHLTLPTILLV